MTKGDLARQNFKSGYNCSQAVALAFQDKIGNHHGAGYLRLCTR